MYSIQCILSYCIAVFQQRKIVRIDKNLKHTDTLEAEPVYGVFAPQYKLILP